MLLHSPLKGSSSSWSDRVFSNSSPRNRFTIPPLSFLSHLVEGFSDPRICQVSSHQSPSFRLNLGGSPITTVRQPLQQGGVVLVQALGSDNLSQARSSPKRKRNKCIKLSATVFNLSFGDDVTMEKATHLREFSLVGRARERKFSLKTLSVWVEDEWKPIFNPPPIVQRLSKGWFSLIFQNKEHVKESLRGIWSINSTSIFLKHWNPLFDASRERMDTFPTWVRFPSLLE